MIYRFAAWLFCLAAGLSALAQAAEPEPSLQMHLSASDADRDAMARGSYDAGFEPFKYGKARRSGDVFWLKIVPVADSANSDLATLNILHGRHVSLEALRLNGDVVEALPLATWLPGFRDAREEVIAVPGGMRSGQPIFVRITADGTGHEIFRASSSTLPATLARATEHSRMIALTFGALMAMSLAAFLIWFVLADRLLLLYASLFSLQALYMAFLTGQAFNWPVLSHLVPVAAYSWNVTAALSGAVACLFVREIADLRQYSPRVYRIFGWLAVAFVVLSLSNFLKGLDSIVVNAGNLMFVGTAAFTLVVAFLAWRRSNRAAGWFLLAWGLLEAFTILTALRLLIAGPEGAELLLFYGLPLSMVAAAVLIALGVADRLRDQRLALTDAERRAQTDALTGVLNRRSLVERLDAACLRAQARGLPIALLFIDLDHFKDINDTRGHLAGDACLKAIIPPIQAELRQSDVIGRYGGEEFVVILSSADASAAHPIAERIRERVADLRVEGFGAPITVTCSIGIATSDMLGVWGEHLIAHADTAVYAAKRSGRNRVQLALAA